MNFIELAGFGPNIHTLSALATLIITAILACGLSGQIGVMRRQGYGQIDAPTLIYLLIYSSCMAVYGFRHERLVFLLSGIYIAPVCVYLLDTIIDIELDTNMVGGQILIPVLLCAVTFMAIFPLPKSEMLMTVMHGIGVLILSALCLRLWRHTQNESIRIRWVMLCTLGMGIWAYHGYTIADMGLMLASSAAGTVLGVFLIAYGLRSLSMFVSASMDR